MVCKPSKETEYFSSLIDGYKREAFYTVLFFSPLIVSYGGNVLVQLRVIDDCSFQRETPSFEDRISRLENAYASSAHPVLIIGLERQVRSTFEDNPKNKALLRDRLLAKGTTNYSPFLLQLVFDARYGETESDEPPAIRFTDPLPLPGHLQDLRKLLKPLVFQGTPTIPPAGILYFSPQLEAEQGPLHYCSSALRAGKQREDLSRHETVRPIGRYYTKPEMEQLGECIYEVYAHVPAMYQRAVRQGAQHFFRGVHVPRSLEPLLK